MSVVALESLVKQRFAAEAVVPTALSGRDRHDT
jgi:hypothetical protein